MGFNKIAKYIICLSIGLSSSICFSETVNLSLNSTIKASTTWEDNLPEKAIDGNAATGWNSGVGSVSSGGTLQWIEIDLGSRKEITEITALVDQDPAGDTVHNVFFDGVLSHTWSGATDKGDQLAWALPESIKAQKIRVETPTTPSWVAWYEISITGSNTASVLSEGYKRNAAVLLQNSDLSIPVIEYKPGEQQLFYSANLVYFGANTAGEILWKLGDYAPVENIQLEDIPSHLSSDFSIKIDSVKLGTGENYWAQLEFVGNNGVEGDSVWKLKSYGLN